MKCILLGAQWDCKLADRGGAGLHIILLFSNCFLGWEEIIVLLQYSKMIPVTMTMPFSYKDLGQTQTCITPRYLSRPVIKSTLNTFVLTECFPGLIFEGISIIFPLHKYR